ncbi:hypothetical protein QBC47DRAFT_389274 [Echria macrotheca]|uniref:Invertebrate defensins family profile domain-containing protein n=1 Tax=Echria macrotheca TaxID=438768 RepID=A0AAJ0B6W9_9PEZI|nr:hypothetical protein QBC47DRAFT_389274 [Echria macrotheca]
MRFITVITVLAGLASAMPEPVAEPAVAQAETLDKRACSTSACIDSCCAAAGCNGYLYCSNSKCKSGKCVCDCRYG